MLRSAGCPGLPGALGRVCFQQCIHYTQSILLNVRRCCRYSTSSINCVWDQVVISPSEPSADIVYVREALFPLRLWTGAAYQVPLKPQQHEDISMKFSGLVQSNPGCSVIELKPIQKVRE